MRSVYQFDLYLYQPYADKVEFRLLVKELPKLSLTMKIIQPYVQPPSALYTVSQQLSQIMKKEEGDPMIFLYLAQPSVSAAIATFMAEPAQQEMKGMDTFNTFSVSVSNVPLKGL